MHRGPVCPVVIVLSVDSLKDVVLYYTEEPGVVKTAGLRFTGKKT